MMQSDSNGARADSDPVKLDVRDVYQWTVANDRLSETLIIVVVVVEFRSGDRLVVTFVALRCVQIRPRCVLGSR